MLTIIIPAYNEAGRIEKSVSIVKKTLQSTKIKKYRIIIAEDGSTDGTYGIIRKLAEKDCRIKISHSDKRLGRGLALKKCGKLIEGNFVVFMDADLSTRLNALRSMMNELKNNDIVVGSRYVSGARYKRTFTRLFLSKLYNLIRMVLFPQLDVKDAQCGFKGFRRNTFIKVNKKTKSNGWFWDTEFLIRANEMKARIKEIPIAWEGDKKTSVRVMKDTLEMLTGLITLKLKMINLLF